MVRKKTGWEHTHKGSLIFIIPHTSVHRSDDRPTSIKNCLKKWRVNKNRNFESRSQRSPPSTPNKNKITTSNFDSPHCIMQYKVLTGKQCRFFQLTGEGGLCVILCCQPTPPVDGITLTQISAAWSASESKNFFVDATMEFLRFNFDIFFPMYRVFVFALRIFRCYFA